MSEVVAYHPGTRAEVVVDEEALNSHLRQSGWMTRDEHEELQARLAEREQAAGPKGKTAPESEGSK